MKKLIALAEARALSACLLSGERKERIIILDCKDTVVRDSVVDGKPVEIVERVCQ